MPMTGMMFIYRRIIFRLRRLYQPMARILFICHGKSD